MIEDDGSAASVGLGTACKFTQKSARRPYFFCHCGDMPVKLFCKGGAQQVQTASDDARPLGLTVASLDEGQLRREAGVVDELHFKIRQL